MNVALIPLHDRLGHLVAWAIIDTDKKKWVRQWRWHLNDAGYAVRHTTRSKNGKLIYRTYRLHRELLGLKHGDPREGDHKDRNRLNCRMNNLRIVEHRHNGQNIMREYGSSKHRGVSWVKHDQKWEAYMHLNGKKHNLGYYTDEAEAAAVAAAFRSKHMPYSVG